MKPHFLFSTLFLFSTHIFAQSTFEQVHAIMQTNCTTSSCHDNSSPAGNLNLTGTTADVYSRLVNTVPTNPAASANGLKLVDPGYPDRSFFMKKVNNGLDVHNDPAQGEGNPMPDGQQALSLADRELIRQWIIWGALDTGNVFNEHLISDFYNNNGFPEIEAPLTPEEEGREGYQVRFGPIILGPGEEFELFQPYYVRSDVDKEIIEMKAVMSPTSHHWVLREIDAVGAAGLGPRPADGNNLLTQAYVFEHTKYMGVWQFSGSIDLPEGTAIYQDSGSYILLNLHIPNYSQDSIIAATAFLNIYTQEAGSGAVEMHTSLAAYGGSNPFILNVPNTGQPYTLQNHFTVPGETRYFWTMQAHTHSRGIDYDMFYRNPDGTKGDQFYEGFYNEDYSFNQGYYDYAHPAVLKMDDLMEVDMDNGLIFEATWLNSGPDTVPFGFTTEEEMFITYFQYTNELPTSIQDNEKPVSSLTVYPNPSSNNIDLSYTLKSTAHAVVELFNLTGSKIKTIANAVQSAGKHLFRIKSKEDDLAPGTYMVSVRIDGQTSSKKVVAIN